MKDDQREGALCQILASRPARYRVWPIEGLFGIAGAAIKKIAIVLPKVGTDEEIVLKAHARVAAAAKRAEGGEAAAQKDPSLNINAMAIEALFSVCRDANEDGTPSQFAAFVGDDKLKGPDWMRANLDKHEIAALHNLYLATDRAFSAAQMMDEGTIDMLVPLLADNLGNTVADLSLAPYGRQDLIDLCVILASRLRASTQSVESLLKDRDEAEEQLRLARMPEADLWAGRDKAKASGDEPLEGRLELELVRRGLLGTTNDAEG